MCLKPLYHIKDKERTPPEQIDFDLKEMFHLQPDPMMVSDAIRNPIDYMEITIFGYSKVHTNVLIKAALRLFHHSSSHELIYHCIYTMIQTQLYKRWSQLGAKKAIALGDECISRWTNLYVLARWVTCYMTEKQKEMIILETKDLKEKQGARLKGLYQECHRNMMDVRQQLKVIKNSSYSAGEIKYENADDLSIFPENQIYNRAQNDLIAFLVDPIICRMVWFYLFEVQQIQIFEQVKPVDNALELEEAKEVYELPEVLRPGYCPL